MKCVCLTLCALFVLTLSAQQAGDIEKTDCFLADCSWVEKAPNTSEFGYLYVPENYEDPESRLLKIAFVILKTTNPNPPADAVLYFQGGWGVPETQLAPGFIRAMPLLKERDVILFDYRGTGNSTRLPCQDLATATWNDLMDDLSYEAFEKKQTARFNACLETMQSEGIDYNQYGMNTLTRDAAFLAQQLPYDTYNLLGISNGTMAIQQFLRNASLYDVAVRSAILDSTVPIGFPIQGTLPPYYRDSLLALLEKCEDQPDCAARYANLETNFIQFLETLDEEPLRFQLEDGTMAVVNKEELNGVLHQLLYKRTSYPNFPLLLEQIMARDSKVLSSLISSMRGPAEANYNANGLIAYVYDHSLQREVSRRNFQNQQESLKPFATVDTYLDFYYQDNRIALDSVANTPVYSEVPALLVAGELDPVTPPKHTELLQERFANGFYFEFPNMGHGTVTSPCGTRVMEAFIANPNQRPQAPCMEQLASRSIPFVTSYYPNASVSSLARGLLQMRNPVLLALTVIILFVLLVNLILGVIRLFKKKGSSLIGLRTWNAVLGLLLLLGLIYFIASTSASNGFLLVMGLPYAVNYLLVLVFFLVALSVLFFYRMFKRSEASLWNLISGCSFFLLIIGLAWYQLWPQF
ncbi:alpha/beta fold hydrolase [Croceiramulus getboli]|nr:alpha/beta hydrolase [Flavobacteriaceae bacterium YJPT1-3]